MVKRPARRSRRNCWRKSSATSGSSSTTRMRRFMRAPTLRQQGCRAGQNNPEFSELAGLGLDFDPAGMLFDDDIVTDGQTEPGALARRFGCKERVEHLFFDLGRDPRPIIANSDLHLIAKVLGRSQQHWLLLVEIGQ